MQIFFFYKNGRASSGTLPAAYSVGTRSCISRGLSGQGMRLSTHLHCGGAIRLFSLLRVCLH